MNPAEYVAEFFKQPPLWIYSVWARLGLMVFLMALIGMVLWHEQRSHLNRLMARYKTGDPLLLPSMTTTEIALYIRDESAFSWETYARLNFWDLVPHHVLDEMAATGRSGDVRFVGVPPNSIDAVVIQRDYWDHAAIDENRVWDQRNAAFTRFRQPHPNVRGLVIYQSGRAPEIDVYAKWPRASFLKKTTCTARVWIRMRMIALKVFCESVATHAKRIALKCQSVSTSVLKNLASKKN